AGGAALRNSFSQTVPMAASPASCQIGAKRIGPIQPTARTYRGHDGNVKPKAARRPPGRVSTERAGTPGFPGEKRARRAAERRPVRQVLDGRIQPLACIRQSCASLKPRTFRALRLD